MFEMSILVCHGQKTILGQSVWSISNEKIEDHEWKMEGLAMTVTLVGINPDHECESLQRGRDSLSDGESLSNIWPESAQRGRGEC